MKMIQTKTIFIGLVLIISVNLTYSQSYNYKIDFFGYPVFNETDTVAFKFNICDLKGNKLKLSDDSIIINNRSDVDVTDTIIEGTRTEVIKPRFIEGSFMKIDNTSVISNGPLKKKKQSLQSEDITVSILIDRSGSMTQSKIDKVNEVLSDLISDMPEGSVFLSWFNNDISPSIPITLKDFDTNKISVPAFPQKSHTALYNAIYTKLLEFDSTSTIPNLEYENLYFRNPLVYRRETPNNYLIVLSDGQDESNKIPKYSKGEFVKINRSKLLNTVETLNSSDKKIEIWMIGIRAGEDDTFDETTMKLICEKTGKSDNYRLGGEEKLPEIFKEVIDIILPDYQILLKYPEKTRLVGLNREVKLKIAFQDGKRARGALKYKKGSPPRPYSLGDISKHEIIWFGILIGVLIIIIVFAVIQVIIPLIRSLLFNIKYVHAYKPDADTEKLSCSWCKEEIQLGEKAVFRCAHISHWRCWKENGYQCPNHPDICLAGKQDFFDLANISSQSESDSIVKQNKRRLWLWVFFGIVAGLFGWILYQYLSNFKIFEPLIRILIPEGRANVEYLVDRYGYLPLLGFLLGGTLSAVFLYLEEFRRMNLMIVFRLFIRSIIGACIGFITFYLGSFILIQIGKNMPLMADIFVWLLFGPCIGYYLSVKTTLSATHGLLGGLISILFSFVTLYLLPSLFEKLPREEYMLVISLTVYGLGLGLSISEIRQRAEKYFLLLSNAPVKNKEFPLHKWISRSADYGTFTIGKSNKNIIRMDWESEGAVSDDVHATIYMEKSNKSYPVLAIRDTKNKTYLNDHILLRPEKEYLLHSGDTFKIGETIFKYVEKQD